MGTWGSGLYANDSTCDVRDTYMGFLRKQLDSQTAYEKTLEQCGDYLNDEDETPLFWFALADTQWRVGRLTPEVKDKALEWIEKEGGLELWKESSSSGAGWLKTIHALKSKLETPAPPEKKIRTPKVVDMNLWNINDVYAYHFQSESSKERGLYGKYILLRKIAVESDYTCQVRMRIQVMDHAFDKEPVLKDIEGLRVLPLNCPVDNTVESAMSLSMFLNNRREYPEENLIFIGRLQTPVPQMVIADRYCGMCWRDADEYFSSYLAFWRGKEYRVTEMGAFMI